MGDVGRFFNRAEFACKCGCGFDDISPELVALLDQIRAHFDRPMTITSGCRCPQHNRQVGGAEHSQHLVGKAADVQMYHLIPPLVAEAAALYGANGIKVYSGWTHIDVRDGRSWHVGVPD